MQIEVGKYYRGGEYGVEYFYEIKSRTEDFFFGSCISIDKSVGKIIWEPDYADIDEDYVQVEISESEFNAARELARSMI